VIIENEMRELRSYERREMGDFVDDDDDK